MHISPLEEYGLRCALSLAQFAHKEPLSARKIADIEGISIEYVSKVMFLLRKSGLVSATRGINGGFYLSKKPNEINLSSVLDALQQKKKVKNNHFCDQFSGNHSSCTRIQNCSIRPVWGFLNRTLDSLFSSLTLQDLLSEESVSTSKINSIFKNSVNLKINERVALL